MTAASLETVTQVLLELDGYPHLSCQMMANGLPHALVGGAGRHECQGQFLDLVRDALRGAERAALEQQAEHGRRVGEEHAAVEAKQAALKEATASAEAATRVATEKEELLEQSRHKVQREEREHKQTERSTASIQKSLAHRQQENEKITFVLDCHLKTLEEGGWQNDEAEKDAAVESVVARLEGAGVEKVLVVAASGALRVKAEERKQFDKVVLEHVRQALEEQARLVGQQVEKERPAAAEADAELLGAWALADVARDQLAAAEEATNEAQAAAEAAVAAQEEARKAVEAQEARGKEASEASKLAEEKARRVGDALAALELLVEGASSAAAEDVEMAAHEDVDMASSKDFEAAEKKESGMHVMAGGNALGVPTPMVA
mmetsp:Transcript_2840/g.7564  ORF Transcript_2840/g.7564 Transcript_2840/m.7564 type:complete len:377 (-) Transcript_2840:161-1291(-)